MSKKAAVDHFTPYFLIRMADLPQDMLDSYPLTGLGFSKFDL
ncbi:hypothetical protein SAMN04488104_101812 [Algoriphagus faecimaris]|uniref:Uncharacterized protein n=1 Tax=Algoriphagus faecimaris TaxID=686796 RepID=A0A1G6SP44_9BACT|nr:hypothetical protein SAMN04488104_101812 [Algoriphagus faecimaris]